MGTADITFTTGLALLDTAVFLAGSMNSMEEFARFTRVVEYSAVDAPHWWRHDQPWRAVSIAYFGPQREDLDDVVVLSEEGDVRYIGNHAPLIEKIPGAGVFSGDAAGWGYLSDVQQIGDTLFAAGYAGQVYKRLSAGEWLHADQGILQQQGMQGGQFAIQVINGPHENAVYAAGCQNEPYHPARACFWNGSVWRDLVLPEVAERLTNMFIESETRVWMCGANGTLLVGNAVDGFQSVSTPDDNQLFLSVCKYGDLLYMGSNMGLFCYEPANHAAGIRNVVTGMSPELQDANIAECFGTVLWSMGTRDLARFDGEKWKRIHHPDNASI